jgi:hypothetical protein
VASDEETVAWALASLLTSCEGGAAEISTRLLRLRTGFSGQRLESALARIREVVDHRGRAWRVLGFALRKEHHPARVVLVRSDRSDAADYLKRYYRSRLRLLHE